MQHAFERPKFSTVHMGIASAKLPTPALKIAEYAAAKSAAHTR